MQQMKPAGKHSKTGFQLSGSLQIRDKPRDPVARFHLGNGATLHEVIAGADFSDNGMKLSRHDDRLSL